MVLACFKGDDTLLFSAHRILLWQNCTNVVTPHKLDDIISCGTYIFIWEISYSPSSYSSYALLGSLWSWRRLWGQQDRDGGNLKYRKNCHYQSPKDRRLFINKIWLWLMIPLGNNFTLLDFNQWLTMQIYLQISLNHLGESTYNNKPWFFFLIIFK